MEVGSGDGVYKIGEGVIRLKSIHDLDTYVHELGHGMNLGAGDYQSVVPRYALGIYRTRQYRLTYTGTAEFMLAKATATVEMSES